MGCLEGGKSGQTQSFIVWRALELDTGNAMDLDSDRRMIEFER
jgi:hypothetical protein